LGAKAKAEIAAATPAAIVAKAEAVVVADVKAKI
jgi:hypothetical protein